MDIRLQEKRCGNDYFTSHLNDQQFIIKGQHTITKVNDNMNMDSTIVGTVNVRS